MARPPRGFPHERLDVYQAALEFVSVAARIVGAFPRGNGPLADQLTRGASSITLNIAEGCGVFGPKEKARGRFGLRNPLARAGDLLRLPRATKWMPILFNS